MTAIILASMFEIAGIGFIFWGFIRSTVCLLVGENSLRIRSLWYSLGFFLQLIGDVLIHSWFVYISAVFLAINLWLWWNSGGGDGMKTKIKKILSKLPVVSPLFA